MHSTRFELDLNDTLRYGATTRKQVISHAIRMLVETCHARSYNAGWWLDPITGVSLIPGEDEHTIDGEGSAWREALFPYVVATKIALIHSEVSEMLEAVRRDSADDKLPQYAGVTAESADVIIRVCDLIGMFTIRSYGHEMYDLGAALPAKLAYNTTRPDHVLLARVQPGGKRF